VLLSLLPTGLAQAAASIDEGLWYARSDTFLQQPVLETLRWLRIVGDTVFLIGVGALVWFVIGLKTGWSLEKARQAEGEPSATPSTVTLAPGRL
jgi:nitric oxide reductase subunit B